jgi:hypothetical protein
VTSGANGRCVDSGIIVAAFAPWHERQAALTYRLVGCSLEVL